MDLLSKVAIGAAIIVVALAVVLVISKHAPGGGLSEAKAENLVLNDLEGSHPNATVVLINESNSTLERNSWNFVFAVVYNGTRACPTLFIEGFDYPATGLVPSIDNLYTSGCSIYGLSTTNAAYRNYVISSPYVAIAESYSEHNPAVSAYVSAYGYNNTSVHAAHYTEVAANMTPLNISVPDAWLINYTAEGAGYSEYVVLNSSGSIVGNYTNGNIK